MGRATPPLPPPSPPPASPFDRLPVELLLTIFTLCVEPLPIPQFICQHESEASSQKSSHPLHLSSVSRRWRHAAFACPTLWQYIDVIFPRPMEDGYECVLLQEWLDRASFLHVDVHKSLYRSELDTDIDELEERATDLTLFAILTSTIQKWVSLRITIGNDNFIEFDLWDPWFQCGLPRLSHLFYDGYIDSTGPIDFTRLPRLTTFASVDSNFNFFDPGHVLIPPPQAATLTHLRIGYTPWKLYDLLASLPALVRAHFTDDPMTRMPEPPVYDGNTARIRLPKLLQLEIDAAMVEDLWAMAYIDAPALKHLRVRDISSTHDLNYWPFIASYFSNSQPPLEHLELHLGAAPFPFPEGDVNTEFIHALARMPELKSLAIHMSVEEDEFMPGMQLITRDFWMSLCGARPFDNEWDRSPEHDVVLCPALEILDICSTDWMSAYDLQDIATALQTRLPRGLESQSKKLRYLTVQPCNFTLDDFLSHPGMKDLVSAGLEVIETGTDPLQAIQIRMGTPTPAASFPKIIYTQ